MSSLCSWPGSRKWTCISNRPGNTILPVRSMRSASAHSASLTTPSGSPLRASSRNSHHAAVTDVDVGHGVETHLRVDDAGTFKNLRR